jgi:predicted enzyme related to lactoylglutathione lyase
MQIGIADFTLATQDVLRLKAFYAALLDGCPVEDHTYFFKIEDTGSKPMIATVPHNGDPKWDHPWVTFKTDDLASAIERLEAIGATDIQNSGPTNDAGEPIACVTFRDPDDRLMMLAASS